MDSLRSVITLAAIFLIAAPAAAEAQHPEHHPASGGDTVRTEETHSQHPGSGVVTADTAAPDSSAHPQAHDAAPVDAHSMWARPLGGGWTVSGMAQLHPIVTAGAPGDDDLPIHDTALYATQPAVMLNVESPGQTLVVHTTLNFEAWTQPEGEYTFGGWGEGFIDKRHPHTLLHEATLSLNTWDVPGGAASLTMGKGFAAFGTADPMGRPVLKFPTNHHLSQILERWLVSGTYLTDAGLSLEASVFGGAEPEDAYDLSNIESFGDSYSARIAQRFGGAGAGAPWELSASWAHVEEAHDGAKEVTTLYNGAIRHAGTLGPGNLYALLEASRSDPEAGEGYWSLLGEGRLELGRHRPYYRFEYATRPEYEREGLPGTADFYRYDHDSHAIGASRWQIHSLGYELEASAPGLIARPFVEAQYHLVSHERGDFDPSLAFGADSFWSLSAGFKLFFGGDSMRMGSYGVLDPMTSAMRTPHQAH